MLLLAVMPYHVIVTRQVLLDGPMVFFATLALWLLARYCVGQGAVWLVAAAAVMGLAVLTKETAVVLVAGVYMFFMLTHVGEGARRPLVAWSLAAMAVGRLRLPAGHRARGGVHRAATTWRGSCSASRTTRSPSTSTTVPFAIGSRSSSWPSAAGLLDRRTSTGASGCCCAGRSAHRLLHARADEGLPVPAAHRPALAASWPPGPSLLPPLDRLLQRVPADRRGMRAVGVLVAVVLSLLLPSWSSVQPSTSRRFLAGSGGLPGGREAGTWIGRTCPRARSC